jgi:hypothetical protein
VSAGGMTRGDPVAVEIARTVAIDTLVMGELVYPFNSRYIL